MNIDIKLVQNTIKSLKWSLDMLDEDYSDADEWIKAKEILDQLRLVDNLHQAYMKWQDEKSDCN